MGYAALRHLRERARLSGPRYRPAPSLYGAGYSLPHDPAMQERPR